MDVRMLWIHVFCIGLMSIDQGAFADSMFLGYGEDSPVEDSFMNAAAPGINSIPQNPELSSATPPLVVLATFSSPPSSSSIPSILPSQSTPLDNQTETPASNPPSISPSSTHTSHIPNTQNATSNHDPGTHRPPTNGTSDESKSALSYPAKMAIIVVGSITGGILLIVIPAILIKKCNKRGNSSINPSDNEVTAVKEYGHQEDKDIPLDRVSAGRH